MTYGIGGIGSEPLSTLSKDLRKKLDPKTSDDDTYKLDQNNYTVEEVANKAKRFLFEQKIQSQYPEGVPNFFIGYRVCGYSSNQPLPEAWEIRIVENACVGPERLYEDGRFGPRWAGETEALDRLIPGIGSKTQEALVQMGAEAVIAEQTTRGLVQHLSATLYHPAMPIQDAIDLAYFLADTASKFAQFSFRAATVGGSVEVATITKHEGFKWVTRKHLHGRLQQGAISAMSLKHLNFSDCPASLPADWTPDKRFIAYEYAPVTPPNEQLQEMQQIDTHPSSKASKDAPKAE